MDKREFLKFLFLSELCENDNFGLSKETNPRKKRRMWMSECYFRRSNSFARKSNLSKELLLSTPDNMNSLRLDAKTYELLLRKVQPLIEKHDTNMRESITANERLAATLLYISTGQSFNQLKSTTSISPQSLGHIVVETLGAVIEILKDYMKLPTSEQEWLAISKEFQFKTNFPHCLGAIGGKHINIIKPHNSGSTYCNYQNEHSIVMMAVVNANYEFIQVEIGAPGGLTQHDIIQNTNLLKHFNSSSPILPAPAELQNSKLETPFVLVGSEAFPLGENLMIPFDACGCECDKTQRIFNHRHARVTKRVTQAFNILSKRFRILLTTIKLNPEKITKIILACCYLHNFLCKKNASVYLRGSPGLEIINDNEKPMLDLQPMTSYQATELSIDIRNKFASHFKSEKIIIFKQHKKILNSKIPPFDEINK